ncbi:ATP-dependent DNA helicase [Colletotrichum chrysophilum]|uniref:ATP-dependent DNA helicase n=1 Tax=Colletotrichum chrysophilum TaxID=1836956 RepID=A0AAD9E8F2_9PEZI|nr:ATP-dependent DNA helicase [Colletotrichum chrysophilum]
MFPAIASDLSKRNLGEPWDILPIIANCCQYPYYLDAQKLLQKDASRNLSILAMCLINGEILNNNPSGPYTVAGMNVFEYLEKLCLPSFAAPPDRDLTYRKGCRFHPISLHEAGITTEGYLWELGDIINTRYLWKPSRRAYPIFNHERFSKEEVDQLARLTKKLGGYRRVPLADGIQRLLSSGNMGENITFARRHMEAMAKEVARAVAKGHQLRLGRLCSGCGSQQQTAIFLSNHKWTYRLPEKEHQGYVFTSSLDNENANDLHRHVCVEVSWVGSDDNIPQLHTRRGILGLCFFPGHKPREVNFPWPSSLLRV